ncbi:MAG: hypothetical protein ABI972_25590, partial [Acidobacteriota bacterium]
MAGPKKQRGKAETPPAAVPRAQAGWQMWQVLLLAFGSLAFACFLYAPALNGPFVLDDTYQLFGRPDVASFRLENWLNNVRPLLNLSYYINYQIS